MKIRSHPVGTTMPRADYAETNPKSAAYVKNKPDDAIQKAQTTADNAQNAANNAISVANSKAITRTYKGTFSASSWSEEAPFVQEIPVDGILSTDYPFVDIDLSDVEDAAAVIEGWTLVGRCTVSADNTVIAYCYEEAPAVDIPIVFKVVR